MAKKKRSRQQQQQDDDDEEEHPVDDVEMKDEEEEEDDDDDEEDDCQEQEDDDNDEDDDEELDAEAKQETVMVNASSPFMDAFYGLAATDPRERAVAAQTILWHIQQPETQADAPYAWQRLLRGLGSGRAAARQGNASALSALLKVGMQSGLLTLLQQHSQDNAAKQDKEDPHHHEERSQAQQQQQQSLVEFVRHQVLTATQPPTGKKKKKGSDERDALFGRLFGIVAVIRSGILVDHATADELTFWVQDLAHLYRTKHWMREPTAHAVCLLLQSCENDDDDDNDTDLAKLVTQVIVPEFLQQGDHQQRVSQKGGTGGDYSPLAAFSAEQVALAMFVQYLVRKDNVTLPNPWNQSLLSKDVMPVLAPILASTSHVTQPRVHLVWDVLAMALTESESDDSKKVVDERVLQSEPDVLAAIFQHVLQEHLLGMSKSEEKAKTTDDRRALALCVLRQWAGVEFISSLAGRTVLKLPVDTLTTVVLAPLLVKRLFVELVSTKDHYLKPLASQVLQQVIEQASASPESRGAVIRALLTASTRFDGQTKSSTLSTLLGWQETDSKPEDIKAVWESTLDFCQDGIKGVANKDKSGLTSHEAVGLVDIMFNHGKFLLRLSHPGGKGEVTAEQSVPDFVPAMIQRIRGFFMTTAFFDCASVKSKKNKSALIKMAAQHKATLLPYDLRCVLSARYYSLLAEQVAADLHAGGLASAVQTVQSNLDDWQALRKAGAKSLGDADDMEESPEDEDESPEKLIGRLQDLSKPLSDEPKKGVHTLLLAANLLSSLLYLHLFNCGAPDDAYEDDDPNVDHADDKDEVQNFMQDINDLVEHFQKLSADKVADEEEETSPLTNLAGFCVNILSSPLTSGSHIRGASPKMLREAIRQFWTQGMITASQGGLKADPELLGILLDALGAKAEDTEGTPENSEEEDSESDAMDEDAEDNDETVFAKAALLADVDTEMRDDTNDDESEAKKNDSEKSESNEEHEEVEVDNSRLQALLQEDDDASVDAGELEHHAGADAALARLIQIKQEARKAGQKAREKIEFSNNVLCVVLLETLLNGKPDGWGSILSPSLILSSLIPLLERRRSLERDLTKLSDKGKDNSAGEKRALLDRITSLLRQRVLKTKVASFAWSPKANPKELVLELGQTLVKQAKERNSKEHTSLVGASLVFVMKALPDSDKAAVAKELYLGAVEEWSRKKTSRLDAKLFEDLIQASPVCQSVLAKPLAAAAMNGKTPFLKSEAFRLLSLLFNPKLHQGSTESDEAVASMQDAVNDVLHACSSALGDADMKKAKRAREVLKTLEKLVDFMNSSKYTPASSNVEQVKKALQSIGSDSDSQGLKALAEKLVPRLQGFEEAEEEDTRGESKKSKKAKKKKGKKKR